MSSGCPEIRGDVAGHGLPLKVVYENRIDSLLMETVNLCAAVLKAFLAVELFLGACAASQIQTTQSTPDSHPDQDRNQDQSQGQTDRSASPTQAPTAQNSQKSEVKITPRQA